MTELQHTLGATASPSIVAPLPVLRPAPDVALSDVDLIDQICRQYEPAIGELYDRYSRLLYTIALRVTGDRSVAEEIIQDVFIAVWQSAGGFRTDGNVKAWLIGIARHRAIDATRTRHFRAQGNIMTLDGLHAVDTASDTEMQVISLLEREQVQRALSELSSIQRSTIELAYYAGCTCVEIATRTGVPIGTVKTRLRLGIAKLRALLVP